MSKYPNSKETRGDKPKKSYYQNLEQRLAKASQPTKKSTATAGTETYKTITRKVYLDKRPDSSAYGQIIEIRAGIEKPEFLEEKLEAVNIRTSNGKTKVFKAVLPK